MMKLEVRCCEATPLNLAAQIRAEKAALFRDSRKVHEIRVHPSIMMELMLIERGRSPLKPQPDGSWLFDGIRLIEDVKELSFSIGASPAGKQLSDFVGRLP